MNKKAVWLVLILIFLDWLDFTLYLYLAKSVFAPQFFPNNASNLMLSFAVFAAAFMARPVGGWLFGKQADKMGRRTPMLRTASLMGVATLGICLIPNYQQIGLLAPWLLLLLRMLQGLALGGEMNISAMFLIEHHIEKPLVIGSYIAMSGALGMFVGGAIATILQLFAATQSWRFVFAIVGLFSILACYFRKQLIESPEFRLVPKQAPIWSRYKQGLVNIALAGAYVSVTVYMCNVFWVSLAIDQQLWSPIICSFAGACAQLCSALLAMPLAYWAKPQEVDKMLMRSMIVAGISAPILFYATVHQHALMVVIGLIGYICANGLLCAAVYYYLYRQLPASIRCQGVATVWALAASLGAVSLPLAEKCARLGYPYVASLLVMTIATLAYFFCRRYSSNQASFLVEYA